jgi:predicted anti-sigma-YlaC factor YlaD
MDHPNQDTLNLYLDGELEPQSRAAVEAHLSACAGCRGELDALRAVFADLEALAPTPPPIDLAPLVLARLAPTPHSHWPAGAWALLAAQIAAVAALAVWLAPELGRRVFAAIPPAEALAWLESLAASWRAPLFIGPAELLRAAGSNALAPLAAIAPATWALIVGAAGVVWLIGNRLLLARDA